MSYTVKPDDLTFLCTKVSSFDEQVPRSYLVEFGIEQLYAPRLDREFVVSFRTDLDGVLIALSFDHTSWGIVNDIESRKVTFDDVNGFNIRLWRPDYNFKKYFYYTVLGRKYKLLRP